MPSVVEQGRRATKAELAMDTTKHQLDDRKRELKQLQEKMSTDKRVTPAEPGLAALRVGGWVLEFCPTGREGAYFSCPFEQNPSTQPQATKAPNPISAAVPCDLFPREVACPGGVHAPSCPVLTPLRNVSSL